MSWFFDKAKIVDLAAKEAAHQKELARQQEVTEISGRVIELCFDLEGRVLDLLGKRPSFDEVLKDGERLSLHRLSHLNEPVKLTGWVKEKDNSVTITKFDINHSKEGSAADLYVSRKDSGHRKEYCQTHHFVVKPDESKVELWAPGISGYDIQLFLASDVGKTALAHLKIATESVNSVLAPAA